VSCWFIAVPITCEIVDVLFSEIIQDIVNKLADKEGSEMAYLREQLAEYKRYMDGEYPHTPEEDQMHAASQVIIDNYIKGKKLKGAGMQDGSKGKKRMFSTYYFLSTPSPRRRDENGESSSSSCSSDSSASLKSVSSTENPTNSFHKHVSISSAGKVYFTSHLLIH